MNRISTCPHCSKRLRVSEQITDKTLLCPHCLAEVDNPQQGFQIRTADLDTNVKRDANGVNIVLVALIGLCIAGILAAFYVGDASAALNVLLVSLAALAALILVAIIRGLIRWGASGARAPIVAALVGIPFLVLGSIAAFVLFLFVTCMSILDPKHYGH